MARIEDMYYPPREPGFALKQEIKALQAQLDALRPVPVGDARIREHFTRMGPKLIGHFTDARWRPVYFDERDGLIHNWDSNTVCEPQPTHVSLPLPPQEPDNA